jgi:hypothetical protein
LFSRHRVYVTDMIVAKTLLTARPDRCLIFYGLSCTVITQVKIKKTTFVLYFLDEAVKTKAIPTDF